jgi:hypothetical protein
MQEIEPVRDMTSATRANLKDVWEIYQAFVACTLGSRLSLHFVSSQPDLRIRDSKGRSMSSEWVDLYYDVHVSSLPSWRDGTDRPANERPDVVIVDRRHHRVALIDAKYRKTGERANADDLLEMQAYLNSFDLTRGGIAYPGQRPEPALVEGQTFRLVELPLLPDEPAALAQRVDAALDALWCPLPAG